VLRTWLGTPFLANPRCGELTTRTSALAELLLHRLLGSTMMMATSPAHVSFPGLIITKTFSVDGLDA
jgi:hypothetical protein